MHEPKIEVICNSSTVGISGTLAMKSGELSTDTEKYKTYLRRSMKGKLIAKMSTVRSQATSMKITTPGIKLAQHMGQVD